MDEDGKLNQQKQIDVVTGWGMIINIFLAVLKIIFGVIINSVALIADGVHSFSDLFTDVVVIIASRASKRPPDATHPYGHGKIETIGSVVIGIVLLVIGGGIGWTAIIAMINQQMNFPGPIVVIIAFLSVVSKEVLFHVTRKIAMQIHSTSLYANAWHHRSDALSSLAVILGGGLSLIGFGYGDHLAGLVVGMMVMAVAGKIIFDALKELSEHALDEEVLEKIKDILNNYEDICQWHKLRTRKIGSEIFVDMHVLVDPLMTVKESHNLTLDIERNLEKAISLPINVLIHIEPCEKI